MVDDGFVIVVGFLLLLLCELGGVWIEVGWKL